MKRDGGVRVRAVLVALLPLFCGGCGDIHKHTTPMIECLRRVENHTPRDHRVEVAKRECGWSPKPASRYRR
jgi:hypothetical protein